jgi:hypothetical protein
LNFNNNKTTFKKICWCLGAGLCNIWWFVFFEFLTPSTLNDHNFFNFIMFLKKFNAPNVPIGGVQVLLRHQKPWSLPVGFGLL